MKFVEVLMQTTEVETASKMLLSIREVAEYRQSKKAELGTSEDTHKAILRAAELWQDTEGCIASGVCKTIAALNDRRDDVEDVRNREKLGAAGACEVVAKILKRWVDENDAGDVMAACFQAIFTLARDQPNRLRFGKVGTCESVTKGLSVWGLQSDFIAWEASKAALNLACDETNQKLLGVAGCCDAVTAILEKYGSTSKEVAWDGSWCASNLSFEHSNRIRLASAIPTLVAICDKWEHDTDVMINVCAALHNLSYVKENFATLQKHNVCERLIGVLRIYVNSNELISETVLWALWMLAWQEGNASVLVSNSTLRLIVQSMRGFGTHNRMVAWNACGLIWALAMCYSSKLDLTVLEREVYPAVKGCIWNRVQSDARETLRRILWKGYHHHRHTGVRLSTATASPAARGDASYLRASGGYPPLTSTKPQQQQRHKESTNDAEASCEKTSKEAISDREALQRDIHKEVLYQTCTQEDWPSAALLLQIAPDEVLQYVSPQKKWSVLHVAILNNAPLWFLRSCLETGKIDPTGVDDRGSNLVFIACAKDVDPDILRLLLQDKRINPALPTHSGWTALHIIAFLGCKYELARLLVHEAGVRIPPTKDEDVAIAPVYLMAASERKPDLKMTQLLLRDALGRIGPVAIIKAQKNKHFELAEYLKKVELLTVFLSAHSRVGKQSKLKMLPNDTVHVLSEMLYL